MFDIGFVELLICGVIALIVLGPERLPTAARAAGRWIGTVRRMVSQFSSELDSQLKAEELRKELRDAGDIGLEDVHKSVRGALDEAKKYEHMVRADDTSPKHRAAPATRSVKDPKADSREPDEDPAAANNSGHSSVDEPQDSNGSQEPHEPRDRAPDNRK